MPKVVKELSALEVKRLTHPGPPKGPVTYSVGGVGGLKLQMTASGGRSWLLRLTVGRQRRELGLGSYPEVSLAKARDEAREIKAVARQGRDPVAEREAARQALEAKQKRHTLFKDATKGYLQVKQQELKSYKNFLQWESTLKRYALPHLGNLAVDQITPHDVARTLKPIWGEKQDTAMRVRSRIEAVMSWATVKGYRTGDNPARWEGNIKLLLPKSKTVKKQHRAAVQLADAPRWFAALRQREGMGSRALEFLVLTAARSGEVRGATWDEIEGDLWTVPAGRMKMERTHRVPLSPQAVALLAKLPRMSDLVFPAARGGQLSDMTLSATMRRMHESDEVGFIDAESKRPAVPHGLRSSFRDWVTERTNYERDMAEIALAHQVGNEVEAAYRRGDMLEKRRAMMTDWAMFLDTGDSEY